MSGWQFKKVNLKFTVKVGTGDRNLGLLSVLKLREWMSLSRKRV